MTEQQKMRIRKSSNEVMEFRKKLEVDPKSVQKRRLY